MLVVHRDRHGHGVIVLSDHDMYKRSVETQPTIPGSINSGCSLSFSFVSFFSPYIPSVISHFLFLGWSIYHTVMGESWFRREFMVPRRLAFNVLFYGAHLSLFMYGWYTQVCCHILASYSSGTHLLYRQLTRDWLGLTH